MIVFTKLLLAHLIGDFVLQPDAWVKDKELKKHRSKKLYLHIILHTVLLFLLLWDISMWLPILTIAISHYCVDLAKVHFQKADTRVFWFVTDQALHVLILAAVWFAWQRPVFNLTEFETGRLLIILTAVIFLTNPASIMIKTVISQWTPDTFYTVSSSLPDAGKFIGYLERLLVLTFILNDHWEAVGFLLAAKSVFRFGNLKESHDRKLTEYVLIGTLLSFGIAIVVSLMVILLTTLFDR